MNADTANHGSAVYDRDAFAQLGCCDGALLARGAAANDHEIVFGYAHHVCLPRMDIASIATFVRSFRGVEPDQPRYENAATYSFALAGSANVTHAPPTTAAG